MNNLVIAGGQSYQVEDLRLRADRMRMRGEREDAELLHALIDTYVNAGDSADLRSELTDLKVDMADLEKTHDKVRKLVREAKKAVKKLPEGAARDTLDERLDDISGELI